MPSEVFVVCSEFNIVRPKDNKVDIMDKFSETELKEALQVVSSGILRCEKTQPKFMEGTSQHTLLKNRIKALSISKALIADDHLACRFTKEELMDALRPVSSIISKCEKAQLKFAEGTVHHIYFRNLIMAMEISKTLIADEIDRRKADLVINNEIT